MSEGNMNAFRPRLPRPWFPSPRHNLPLNETASRWKNPGPADAATRSADRLPAVRDGPSGRPAMCENVARNGLDVPERGNYDGFARPLLGHRPAINPHKEQGTCQPDSRLRSTRLFRASRERVLRSHARRRDARKSPLHSRTLAAMLSGSGRSYFYTAPWMAV